MAELVNKLPGQDPALLLKQEGVLMAGVDVSTRKCDGQVVVALRGQLDMAEAAVRGVAARGRGMGWMRTWRRVWSFGSFATS
jgi:hypothetical protein